MESQAAAPAAPATLTPAESANLDQAAIQSGTSKPDVTTLQNKAQTGTPTEKKEAKKLLNKLQIKVDGRIEDIELPFQFDDNPEAKEYLQRNLQKSKAFDKRAAEYTQLEKEVRGFIEELRKNPAKVLRDPTVGVDIKKLAASVIEEEIANSKKSPEQLAKEGLEAELKAIKQEREKEKEENKAKEFERLQSQEFERYDMLMTKALESSDLPKSPYVVKKIADYMLMGLQEGIDVAPEDVLPLVREEMQGDLKEMFAVMPDEVIEAIVGKDILTRLRKKNLKKAQSAPPTPINKSITDVGTKKGGSNKEPAKKVSMKSFFGI